MFDATGATDLTCARQSEGRRISPDRIDATLPIGTERFETITDVRAVREPGVKHTFEGSYSVSWSCPRIVRAPLSFPRWRGAGRAGSIYNTHTRWAPDPPPQKRSVREKRIYICMKKTKEEKRVRSPADSRDTEEKTKTVIVTRRASRLIRRDIKLLRRTCILSTRF